MHCIWFEIECQKCGIKAERKYCVHNLQELDKFKHNCSCGNGEQEFFSILDSHLERAVSSNL